MFNTRKVIILVSAVMIALFTSCKFNSFGKKSTNVVFDFTSISGKTPTASRSALDTIINENEACYIDLKIQGSYEYSQTINLKETQVVQIENIPVGAIITAAVELYIITKNPDDETETKTILYNGESKTYTIISGENAITVPLKKVQTSEEPGSDPEPEPEPVPEPEPEDTSIKIYVKWAEDKQGLSAWTVYNKPTEAATILESDKEDNDGQTPDTGFNYIQSAADWIIENGNIDEDYKIILTGYDETHKFDQGVEFKSDLSGHMNSVTLTCDKPDIPPFKVDEYTAIYVHTTYYREVILKNIKISKTSNIVEVGAYDNVWDSVLTLSDGAVFYGAEGVSSYAIVIYNGAMAKMNGTSQITGFTADGAVVIDKGRFEMYGDSKIYHCSSSEGGAIYSNNLNNAVILNDNASITECTATSSGGAVYLRSGSISMNDNSSITACQANDGGAIYMNTNTKAFLNGGKIRNNTATNGAAIYSENGATVDVSEGFDINESEISQQ